MLLDSVVLDVARPYHADCWGKHERVDIHLCVEPGSFLLVEGAALSGENRAPARNLSGRLLPRVRALAWSHSNPALTLSGIFGDVVLKKSRLASRMSLRQA